MEKKEVLQKILNHGFQISPEALDMIRSEDEARRLIDYVRGLSDIPPVIDEVVVGESRNPPLKVIKGGSTQAVKRKITPTEVVNYNNKRYEALKKILLENILESPISINKVTTSGEKFSLIAMVESINKDKKTILVDDTTGELELHTGENNINDLLERDVLLFNCEKEGEKMWVVGMKWPDTPFRKEIKKSSKEIKCMFLGISGALEASNQGKLISSLSATNGELYLFVFDKSPAGTNQEAITNLIRKLTNSGVKKIILITNQSDSLGDITYLTSPVVVCVSGITILLGGPEMEKYRGLFKEETGASIMLGMLKRRDLNPMFDIHKCGGNKEYIIENVPDIFASSFAGNPETMNYKGTTLISTGDYKIDYVCWVADLRSRTINKLNVL